MEKLPRKIAAENCCGKFLRKIAAENCCGKLPRKIAAENLGGHTEFMRLVKIQAYDGTMADVEISAPKKISAPSQNLSGKVWRPLTIWAESSTADFLLVWLKSSRSDRRRCVDSQTCRPQVI